MKVKIYSLLFLALGFVLTTKAQLTGYSNVTPITVYNSATVTAINYQLKLTINTQSLIAASQMQTNGNDIRFGKNCNGSTLYNHWLESGINTATTIVWVRKSILFLQVAIVLSISFMEIVLQHLFHLFRLRRCQLDATISKCS